MLISACTMTGECNTDRKKEGFQFWRETLNSCQYIVAPMVDQSELAWRMLSRKYAAQLCYTPMFHSSVFVKDQMYRREALQTCEADRPLIIQFCANDPETFLAAATLAQAHCDAIDLNLGCPQKIAKTGHYGAYLQDEWELIEKMVSTCHTHLKVPITCKIRIFEDLDKTIRYAQMLEKAGCQLLTVHGRTREMKGRQTGLADWKYVKAIKEAVNIPVFSNGNIQYLSDVKKCLQETGVEGVMTAEGNLHNPALFADLNPPVWEICDEYLDLVDQYPCPLSYIRGHVFKILHHALHLHQDVRDMVATAKTSQCLRTAVQLLKEKCQERMKDPTIDPRAGLFGELPLPYWLCQPYERPSAEEEERNREKRDLLKRPLEIVEMATEKGISRKKIKKQLRNPNKDFDKGKKVYEICAKKECNNISGSKCHYNLCKGCCRAKTASTDLICDAKGHGKPSPPLPPGHPILEKKRRAKELKELQEGRSLRDDSPVCDTPDSTPSYDSEESCNQSDRKPCDRFEEMPCDQPEVKNIVTENQNGDHNKIDKTSNNSVDSNVNQDVLPESR